MKKIKNRMAILGVCMILGIVLAIQFKTVSEVEDVGYLPIQRSKELALKNKNLQKEHERALEELAQLKKKLKDYEEHGAEDNIYIQNILEEKNTYKMLSGYEEIEGPGIRITIDEGETSYLEESENSIVTHYRYLIDIINYLNASDAEAIEVNGMRYTGYSELLRVGDVLAFNGKYIGPPIEIRAIGNPENLEAALRLREGIMDYWEKILDKKVMIRQEERIKIPAYEKIKLFRYGTSSL